jgi:hypothetical protein
MEKFDTENKEKSQKLNINIDWVFGSYGTKVP